MNRTKRNYQRNLQVKNPQRSDPKLIKTHGRGVHNQLGPSRYMPGLDGLRALAVFAVIAYHLNFPWASGGLLGVSLFFVLSGYLITDLLTTEWSLSGRIDLKEFWLRRARRLLPTLFVLLAGVMAWTALINPAQLTSLGQDALAAVFYSSNWWFIFHHVSYFASLGAPSPLGHLWSLAVEEQFYLVWPLLLWLGLYFVQHRRRLVGLTLIGVLASAIAMALIYQPGTDPSRVYYGTDTRAFALLLGAALALVWPSRKLSVELSSRNRFSLDVAGGAGLLIILLMIWHTNEYDAFLYRGGLLFFSLVSTVVVAVLAHPASRLGKLFALQPLRWLGVFSYGIYLWHYPVIVWTTPSVNTEGPDILLALWQIVACIVLAALNWLFIEEPIRRGAQKKPWGEQRKLKQRHFVASVSGRVTLAGAVLVLVVSCFVIIGCVFITDSKRPNLSTPVTGTSQVSEVPAESQPGSSSATGYNHPVQDSAFTTESSTVDPTKTPALEQGTENSTTLSGQELNPPADPSPTPKPEAETTVATESGKGVTVIGDSVMVGAEPALKKLLPGIVVNAQVGRQLNQASSVVAQLRAQGDLGERVVVELGTNGPFTEEQLTDLLRSLGQVQQIVLVNTRVSKPWEDVVNQTLMQVAATYPHTTLVNWHSASSGHNAYFYSDGVHLNPTGIQAYASLVAKAIDPS